MSTFKLIYKNGKTETVQTDAVDVADQINRTFGLTPEEAEAFGVGAEMLDDSVDLANAARRRAAATGESNPQQSITVHVGESSEAGDKAS